MTGCTALLTLMTTLLTAVRESIPPNLTQSTDQPQQHNMYMDYYLHI